MMTKVKKYIDKYGIIGCIFKMVLKVLYPIVFRVYVSYVKRFLPVDDKKVVFMSKPAFSDNSLALYEYYQKTRPDYGFVWMIKKTDRIPRKYACGSKIVRTKGKWHNKLPLKSVKELLTAKYVYFTHGSPFQGCEKRQEQVVINLWHGCGYKDREATKRTYLQDNYFDYGLVPGQVFIEKKAKFWGCRESQVIALGYPRYDLLFKDSARARKYVSSLKKDAAKFVMWMPTLRYAVDNDYPENYIERKFDLPILNSVDHVKELDNYCKEKSIHLCIKRHPAQREYVCEKMKFSCISFINNDDLNKNGVALYDMIHYSDAMISDYSSVAIDYLLLNKPVAFCLDDYTEYENARGFVFSDPLKYMPGHHLYEYEDLMTFLEDVSLLKDPYAQKRTELMSEVQNPCTNYCERIIEFVESQK